MKKIILTLLIILALVSYGKEKEKDTKFSVISTSENWENISSEFIVIDFTDKPVTGLWYSKLDSVDAVEYSPDGMFRYELQPKFKIDKQDSTNVLKQLRVTYKKRTIYKIKKIEQKK